MLITMESDLFDPNTAQNKTQFGELMLQFNTDI